MSPRVLVVDDDPDIRQLVAMKLTKSGHTVTTAADGASALASVRAQTPDIIVLDVAMPGLSGLDVCRELRQDPVSADVPVLLLTAKVQDGDLAEGFAAGADDYVTKPFSPRELVTRVEAVLARVATR